MSTWGTLPTSAITNETMDDFSAPMFDVLAFLLETYQDLDTCPDRDGLSRDLAQAGFEDDEINDALNWLEGLTSLDPSIYADIAHSSSIRVYAEEECERLPVEIRGFIHYLEQHNGLTPPQREMLIERLLELSDEDIDIQVTKLIALMVLWSQKAELPILIGEELLAVIHGDPTMQ